MPLTCIHYLLIWFFSSTFILWWISWPSYIREHKYLYFSTLVVIQVCSFKESLCKNIYNSFFTQLFSPGGRVFIQTRTHTHTHTHPYATLHECECYIFLHRFLVHSFLFWFLFASPFPLWSFLPPFYSPRKVTCVNNFESLIFLHNLSLC